MRALKGLVIGLGILILIGFGVVVVAVVQRVGDGAGGGDILSALTSSTPSQVTSSPPPPAAFGDVKLAIPAGAEVIATSTDGGRLVVRLRLAGGAARVLVVDLATGERLGAIDLAP